MRTDDMEIVAFREQLARKARAVEAAQVSLLARVRELTGGNYSTVNGHRLVPLKRVRALDAALAEYDRVKAIPAKEFTPTDAEGPR